MHVRSVFIKLKLQSAHIVRQNSAWFACLAAVVREGRKFSGDRKIYILNQLTVKFCTLCGSKAQRWARSWGTIIQVQFSTKCISMFYLLKWYIIFDRFCVFDVTVWDDQTHKIQKFVLRRDVMGNTNQFRCFSDIFVLFLLKLLSFGLRGNISCRNIFL